jgi:hypothetical protein
MKKPPHPAEWTRHLPRGTPKRSAAPARVSCDVLDYFRSLNGSGATRIDVQTYVCTLHPTESPRGVGRYVDDRMGNLVADGVLTIRDRKWFLVDDEEGLPQ